MFLILPHSAEVRHGKIPWVVTTISLLCLFICYLQEGRREAINTIVEPYCESIHDPSPEDGNDFLSESQGWCESNLTYLHDLPDRDRYKDLQRFWWESLPVAEEPDKGAGDDVITQDELDAMTQHAYQHYEIIRNDLPPSLDRKLVYDPSTPNPIRAITSSLAHADWWHVIGNLIFFFAFAPALEYIIANALRFTLALLGIIFSVALADSLATLLGSPGNITLGLSGVVSGTIGMAAYLMPNVRIRTFVWFFHFARNIPIPAWILAVWYIGWDIYDLSTSEWLSGINFLAHVAGGISGYFIARYFFKARKAETVEEVADEIAYMTSKRQDQLGIMSSYRSSSNHLSNALREERARKEYERHIDTIHQAVNTGRDSKAIMLLLDHYECYQASIEIYETIYQEMLKWKHTRTILCLSRLLISEYIKQQKYAKAVEIAKTAYAITPQFVFADEQERKLLNAMSDKYQLGLPTEDGAA